MWWKGDSQLGASGSSSGSRGSRGMPPKLPKSQSATGLPLRNAASRSTSLPGGARGRGRQQALGSAGKSVIASRTPSPAPAGNAAMAIDAAKEVMRIDKWSVRTLGKDLGLVYVNMETGEHQTEPPRDVLFALEMGGDEDEDAEKAYAETHGPEPESVVHPVDDAADSGGEAPASSPRYRRVVLGASCEVPLMMAKDILKVLQEDPSIAPSVQKRFSEFPTEKPFRLSDLRGGASGNEAEVEALSVGQVTEVFHTDDAHMQIWVRVS